MLSRELIAVPKTTHAHLQSRPERNIVVVSHGVFLETLLNRATLYCADDPLRLKRFENAEMRSIVIGGWTSPLAH